MEKVERKAPASKTSQFGGITPDAIITEPRRSRRPRLESDEEVVVEAIPPKAARQTRKSHLVESENDEAFMNHNENYNRHNFVENNKKREVKNAEKKEQKQGKPSAKMSPAKAAPTKA